MSWQEELRKLDEELAAGQISADDYRVRRDQVLSSAVSSGPEVKPGQQEATQFLPQVPAQPAQPPQPQPAAVAEQQQPQPPQQPQPGQPPAQDGDADKTQIVPGATTEDADRTQSVGGWQTSRPGGDADRTQVVPGVPPQRMAGGAAPRPAPGPGQFPPYGGYQQPWQQGEELAPPWAGAEFPPLTPHGSPDWIKQGPEVFESDSRSRTGCIALIVVVVLIVAGLGVGGYLLLNRNKDANANQQPPPPQTTSAKPTVKTTPPRPKDDLEVAELPGQHEPTDHIKTYADAEKGGGFLTADEMQAYKTAGAGTARFASTVLPNGMHAFVFTTAADSPAKASTAKDALAKLQLHYGLTAYANPPSGVPTEQIAKSDKTPATIRAHYTHKGTVVRVQVWGDDLALVQQSYDEVIALQLKALAADG